MKVTVQGSGPVTLSQNDFVGQGGQASVWVKGGTAYKVYTNPAHAIPAAKVKALSSIADPAVVKPKALLLGLKDEPIGYAMDAVSSPHSLCQLFVPAFRDRHKLPADVAPRLAAKLRGHVHAVHRAGALVVDLNELNVLVASTFEGLYLIDVDSYQCAGFPATALMPSVQDWSATKIVPGKTTPRYDATELTDWYSYAILAFQLFIGCHPFKGSLRGVPEIEQVPKTERLEWRARRNLSAFRAEAKLPPCCYPFDVIPRHFKDWLVAVLDKGERFPPPDPSMASATLPVPRAPLRPLSSEGKLSVEKIDERDGVLLAYVFGLFLSRKDGVPTVWFEKMLSWQGDWMRDLGTGQTMIGFTPKLQRPVAFRLSNGVCTFYDFDHKKTSTLKMRVDEMAPAGERFLVRCGSYVFELDLLELAEEVVITSTRKVADVLPLASRLFEGCAIQSLLGSVFVSLFPKARHGYQVRIPELDGVKVLDAKFMAWGPQGSHGGVLMVVGAKNGVYDRFVFRFGEKFDSYDVRTVADVDPSLLNFVVVPASGATAALVEDDKLEVFSAREGHAALRTIESPVLGGDLRLCLSGDGIGFTRGGELWRMRLK